MLGYSREELHDELRNFYRKTSRVAVDAASVEAILDQSIQTATSGFPPIHIQAYPFRGKSIFRIDDVATSIVLNRTAKILRSSNSVKQTDRTTTLKRISRLLAEGAAHRVYKFDVQSFYESIDLSQTWDIIDGLNSTDRQTSKIIRSFVDLCRDNDIEGVPRGLGISAVLAEIALQEFDARLRAMPTTYFYSRYVDDILLVTSGAESLAETTISISDLLPPGLSFHPQKSQQIDLLPYAKGAAPQNVEVDFLGYRIHVSGIARNLDDKLHRVVSLDISPKKIARMKTRLARATLEFLTDGNFKNLEDRIRILSGNYNIIESRWRRRINVGLYCNYRLVDHEKSTSLPEIDAFYRAWIQGFCGGLSTRLAAALAPPQAARLMTYSFLKSFKTRRFYHFSADRLRELRECWIYA